MLLQRDADDGPEILAWWWDGHTYFPITFPYLVTLIWTHNQM